MSMVAELDHFNIALQEVRFINSSCSSYFRLALVIIHYILFDIYYTTTNMHNIEI